MTENIEIKNIPRIEGEGVIQIILDTQGRVKETSLFLNGRRGLEELCKDRNAVDLPLITSKVCGICSVAQYLASIKAIEDLSGVEIPESAHLQRQAMMYLHIIQSHLYFFYFLALPDYTVQSFVIEPEVRSFNYLFKAHPQLMMKVLELNNKVLDLSVIIGGRPIVPVRTIIGGMSQALTRKTQVEMIEIAEKAKKLAVEIVGQSKRFLEDSIKNSSANLSLKCFLGMISDSGVSFYDGQINLSCSDGSLKKYSNREFKEGLSEIQDDISKFPAYFIDKESNSICSYLTGPLARFNLIDNLDKELAQKERQDLIELAQSQILTADSMIHSARLIEILYATEKIVEILSDERIISDEFRVPVKLKAGNGLGLVEAPRGTLLHYYEINEQGRIEKVKIITPTIQNLNYINQALHNKACEVVIDGQLSPENEETIKTTLRCYDPCVNCAVQLIQCDS